MTTKNQVFLSYTLESRDFVEQIAARLQNDARLSFWFAPWHSIPGVPIQEQMEQALWDAGACAIFISDASHIQGWQSEQMRVAIQTRVEDDATYRVIPVMMPGTTLAQRRLLPSFLRRYEPVVFQQIDDETAFKYLVAGILGVRPIEVEDFVTRSLQKLTHSPRSTMFNGGYALIIGIAQYTHVPPLPQTILHDAMDMRSLLLNPDYCAYQPENVVVLLDEDASASAIRNALKLLSQRIGPDDTAFLYFSGHGTQIETNSSTQQYLLAHDFQPESIADTAISSSEMTEMLNGINAGRLLVLFDTCHSGGIGDPKINESIFVRSGLDDNYYSELTQSRGRVVMASCRNDELSWTFPELRNSLFTHYVLDALQGQAQTLGDGYIRVFDLFRHVALNVPQTSHRYGVEQHPIFKAHALDDDFPVAIAQRFPVVSSV